MPVQTHDYVIVGGGSAGCVLANRLSEDGNARVLLLEAGGAVTGALKDMPMAFPRYVLRKDLNWNFVSEPEPYLGGRRVEVPRGKALGGSSAINGMVYARGYRADYDDWARAGLIGWGYADVLPYFERSQLEVHVPPTNMMYAELRDATAAAGYQTSDDEGAQRSEMTIIGGRRGNVARLYLAPIMSRRNLTIASRARATRVLLEGTRAVGVEYLKDGKLCSVRAAREVVLCGGAYGSPSLLMLSGIGPAAELHGLGISPTVDLPGVGRNLIEHPFLFLRWQAHTNGFVSQMRFDRAVLSVLRWALFGSGPFATNGAAGHVFIRTLPGLDRPDMQLTCIAAEMSAGELWYPLIGKLPVHLIGVGVSMIKQDSRGAVSLRSSNPLDPPRILFNLFQQRSDMERMIRGIRAARRIYGQDALKHLVGAELEPGSHVESDAELEIFVRRVGAITQHPVGTCRMGTAADAGAVVDAELKVRGLSALRVVDASIMPNVPSGNTNAPTIMVAEKGADIIRGRQLPAARV